MGGLFWRIFALFWFASLVLIVAMSWSTAYVFENEKIPGLGITRLESVLNDQLRGAARVMRERGEQGVRELVAEARKRGIRLYVLDAEQRDLADQPIPAEILAALGRGESDVQGARTNRRRLRTIHAADGKKYTSIAEFTHPALLRMLYRRPNLFWTQLAIASAISAMFSLLLAAWIALPLGRIRASTRRVAQGDLDARVGALSVGRNPEMLSLASEFDQMAARLKDLVEGQRRLIRDVSHEMRSPLARLRVALELARAALADPSQTRAVIQADRARTESVSRNDDPAAPIGRGSATATRAAGSDAQLQLDRIERESERLEEMIGQAIGLSRMETTVPEHIETIALDALVADIAADAAFEAQARPCTIEILESMPLRVRAETDLLTSAIENVIRNAINYTASGSTVRIRLDRVTGQARLRVDDAGPGVPDADCARIFEPYYRTDAARARKSGGSGLGLAIAKRAVERQGGRICARNREGGGLEIEVLLPLL